MSKLSIPVGISNFEKIRNGGFYYIDKTGLIAELVRSSAEVTLITRPRRFGKTLGMSMLESFFDIRKDSKKLFDGLEISHQKNLCEKWMNQWPVVFLSLKNVDGIHFSDAYQQLVYEISLLYQQHDNLLKSTALSDRDKFLFKQLQERQAGKMDIMRSLQFLTRLLEQHYGKKVILLIDEYDVPIAKANSHGYYNEMMDVIKGLMQALKDNPSLHFAVITGCLKIAKESIFTGLNNFKVYAADDVRYDEEFGFTNEGVKKLLANYNLQEHFEKEKERYDGYHFGDADIYCPWDVINYVDDLVSDPNVQPKSYWINSSGNDLVKRFIEQADITTKDEIEQLIAGNAVEKRIRSDLTYDEIDNSIDNIWSVLFTTGYLTRLGKAENGVYKLIIPNQEVREVFVLKIREWFNQIVANNRASTNKINQGFLEGEAETIQQELTMFLGETIRVFDTKARNEEKEIFYHGILLGILKNYSGWVVKSNRESGDGFSDIMIQVGDSEVGIVIEVKYANDGNLEAECKKALKQIDDTGYAEALHQDGICKILKYAIACYKKTCKIMLEAEKC